METIIDASLNTNTNTNTNVGALSRDDLIQVVKEWIKIDNELTKLKSEVKLRNDKRKKVTEKIVNHMKHHALDGVAINNGSLVYKQRKTKKPITGKYLLTQLEKFYADKPEVAKDVAKHLLDNREQVIKEDITRKMNKVEELVSK
uniref:Uncharacterized protein n=1 Tax=viral metagenome TaxID=1070528 RepID=A0A6C0ISF6_9ZZZZ